MLGWREGTEWVPGRDGAEQECCSCFPPACGGSRNHSSNEMWGKLISTWKDFKKTRNCSSYWDGWVTERRALHPQEASTLENLLGCHPGTHIINIRVFFLKIFLLLLYFGFSCCLSKRKHGMRVRPIQTPRMFQHFTSPFSYLHLLWRVSFKWSLQSQNLTWSSCSPFKTAQTF